MSRNWLRARGSRAARSGPQLDQRALDAGDLATRWRAQPPSLAVARRGTRRSHGCDLVDGAVPDAVGAARTMTPAEVTGRRTAGRCSGRRPQPGRLAATATRRHHRLERTPGTTRSGQAWQQPGPALDRRHTRLRSSTTMISGSPSAPRRPGRGQPPGEHGYPVRLADGRPRSGRQWPAPSSTASGRRGARGQRRDRVRAKLTELRPARDHLPRVAAPRHRGHADAAAARSGCSATAARAAVGYGPASTGSRIRPARSARAAAGARAPSAADPISHRAGCSSSVLGWTAPKLRGPAAADRWT